MRSLAEISFRLRQEFSNVALLLSPPSLRDDAADFPPFPGLPHPRSLAERLSDTPFRHTLRMTVEQILAGRIPALGLMIETGRDVRWRRDYLRGIETAPLYFRRIPYLDPSQVGDHKIIWEINRHQHLVALAEETIFADAHPGAIPELLRQIESWLEANPFQRGINWTSALEVGFRSLSWIWIQHFAGSCFPGPLRKRFLTALYRHGVHLEHNLSVYFSPNTHLLGEGVALYAMGKLFPQWSRSAHWTETGSRIVLEELGRQVREDGSHFEQSSYYHVYALDMFIFFGLLARPGREFHARLSSMAEYLDNLLGPSRLLPMLGDDDGGRFYFPYGDRSRWAEESLEGCEYPRSELKSHLFQSSGVATMVAGDMQVIADAGSFGTGSAGHSHSDTLSIIVRRGAKSILIDPGTYTYADARWRDRFRGSAAHNTIRIDGHDQAVPSGPFGWRRPHPEVSVSHWSDEPAATILEAKCRYNGFLHRRRLVLLKPEHLLVIADDITKEDRLDSALHHIEWFWHTGQPAQVAASSLRIGDNNILLWDHTLAASLTEGGEYGWRSEVLGVKETSPVLRLEYRGQLPIRRIALLDCGAPIARGSLIQELGAIRYGTLKIDLETGAVAGS